MTGPKIGGPPYLDRIKESSMRKRSLQLLIIFVLTGAWAADNRFIGDWKLDPSKSKLTDRMKIAAVGENKYAFDFEGDVETIVIDGTDQPGIGGTTLSVTAEGPDAWKVVRKRDGKVVITGNWKLSPDGNTLTDDFTGVGPDGSASNVNYKYQRKEGGPGFAGTWVSASANINFVYVLRFRPYQGDGLSIIDSTSQLTRNMKLDGKDYPNTGQNAAIIAASSLRRLDEHTLELTDKRDNGKILATQKIQLSSDGKTLTMTPRDPGGDESSVLVFERQ